MSRIIWKIRCEDILLDLIVPENSNGFAMIICPGLPSIPDSNDLQVLADLGYYVFHFRYRGTWESNGEFLKYSPTEDIKIILNHIAKGILIELFNNAEIKIPKLKVIIAGGSFGGSVALCCDDIPDVSAIVSLCPVVDFKDHNSTGNEQNLRKFKTFLKAAFGKCYYYDEKSFDNLLEGKLLQPTKYLNRIKPLTIIQGQKDKSIDSSKVRSFFDRIKCSNKKLILLPESGHLSFRHLKQETISELDYWIKSL